MGMKIEGLTELQNDLQGIADNVSGSAVDGALRAGANILLQQMEANASTDPHPRSGNLKGAIRAGGIKGSRGRKKISIGVHKNSGVKYAMFVEFGHGGPHPAPAHPFIRPAYDQKKDAAYQEIRNALKGAVNK